MDIFSENGNTAAGRGLFFNYFPLLLIFINIAAVIAGIIYLSFSILPLWENIAGGIIIVAWTGNLVLVFFNSRNISGSIAEGSPLETMSTVYPLFKIIAMLLMAVAVFFISASYSEAFSDIFYLYFFLYLSFFGTLILGIVNALYTRKPEKAFAGNNFSVKEKNNLIAKILLLLFFAFLIFAAGASLNRGYAKILETFVSQLSIHFAFVTAGITILLLKHLRREKKKVAYGFFALCGSILLIIFLLPPLSMINKSPEFEKEFTGAFGDYRLAEQISTADEYFSHTLFSLPAYFLGAASDNYKVFKDQLYFEGRDGVDKGISLYYDLYLPDAAKPGFPDPKPVLVRIHGGGWTSGGKGLRNMMQVNKYFASQGYAVFDVQYGLTTVLGGGPGILGAPDHLTGAFSLDDMVRHLGLFTFYLEENQDKFNLDLDAVFFSGGSAGGHLATAVALASSSGNYIESLSDAVTVKGLIPFYPANEYHLLPDIGGSEEWLDVELLVEESSPPCLIFQGTHDGLVPPEVAVSFKEAYSEAGNNQCALIMLPYCGHASDLFFTGYYNSVFIYYMERFMALYR